MAKLERPLPHVSGEGEVPPPPSPATPRVLGEEVLIVLSLSLLYSAVTAIINLTSAPIAGISVFIYPNVNLAQQVTDIVFGLAPVALVAHLVRRNREGLQSVGLGTGRLVEDFGWGVLAALAVAAVGLGVYLAAIALKVNRFVVPVPPLHHWWTVPLLLLGSAQAALLEEVIAVGYLLRRLEQIGWGAPLAMGASALLRASYHLYQGWGGFAGNLALGLAFALAFWRWRRTWPLVVAHFLVDSLAGIGYIVYVGHCFFGVCIR
jgi:membrane protease YdiL (CAAX protease family)